MTVYDILARLAHAFPRSRTVEGTIRVMADELSDLPIATLDRAASWWIRHEDWMPTTHQLRNRCAEMTLSLPSPQEALEDALGTGRPHPAVKHALDLSGGRYAGRHADNPGVWRSQFLRTYEDIRRRQIDSYLDEGPRALEGGTQ